MSVLTWLIFTLVAAGDDSTQISRKDKARALERVEDARQLARFRLKTGISRAS
jgi:hypothetical protein